MSETPRETLERIAQGFVPAKVLFAAVELGLFDALPADGLAPEELATRLGLPERGVGILVWALASLGLLEIVDGSRVRVAERFAPLLADREYVALLRHRGRLFRAWAVLEQTIRQGRPAHDEPDALDDPEANEAFILAMAAVSRERAPQVLARLELDGASHLADLGGGPGLYVELALREHPRLRATLIDLPLTLEVARRRLAGRPELERLAFLRWDFYREPEPERPAGPFDRMLISQVLHAESPENNRALFARLAPLLATGALVVIHENAREPERWRPPAAALFAVNMLAMTAGGDTYTVDEIAEQAAAGGLALLDSERLDERSVVVRLRAR
ncbi:MAG: methyltransferase [Acidobacteriota bacterium]